MMMCWVFGNLVGWSWGIKVNYNICWKVEGGSCVSSGRCYCFGNESKGNINWYVGIYIKWNY